MIDEEGMIHCSARAQDWLWGRLFAKLDRKLPEEQRMRASQGEK